MNNTHDVYYRFAVDSFEFQIYESTDTKKTTYSVLDIKGDECIKVYKETNSEFYLSGLKYRPFCPIKTPVEPGIFTILMIKGFLTFLIEKESELQTILFYDTSTFACNFLNDDYSFDISLPYHNFIVYGKTWYERSLNATIKDDAIRSELDDSLLLLHSPIKDEMFIRKLYNKIQQQLKFTEREEFIKYLEEIHKILYIPYPSWMSLFYNLFAKGGVVYTQCGSEFSCNLFSFTYRLIIKYFNIPHLEDELEMELRRDIIEEYGIRIETRLNTNPVHKKRQSGGRQRHLIGFSTPFYSEGQDTRRVRTRLPKYKHIPTHHRERRRTRRSKEMC
jgi:hypothetical protein